MRVGWNRGPTCQISATPLHCPLLTPLRQGNLPAPRSLADTGSLPLST